MEEFTNELIDIKTLPKFEEIQYNVLHPKYFRIILINICIFFFILLLGIISVLYINEEIFTNRIWLLIGIVYPIYLIVMILYYNLSFKKRGYAFRTHDVIYKSGLIRETTVIIPNNRVQHVALHQGFFSRLFGLATIELFTAGGNSSDLKIPGLVYEEALRIKSMISLKINDAVDKIENKVEDERVTNKESQNIEEENNEN